MDDLLDLMETNEKPFQAETTTTAQGSNKPTGMFAPKAEKINLWEDTDIAPTPVDPEKLSPVGKFYTMATYTKEGEIPESIANKMVEVSKALMTNAGFMFRYNGEQKPYYNKILDIDLGRVEMYNPWKKFNTNITPKMVRPVETAYHHAAYYHKGFKKLPNPTRTILARDVHTILGENCLNPIKMFICYSADGCESVKGIKFETTGYISFAITICDMLGIPVFNLGNDNAVARISEYVKTL